jgi:glycosyltransferase involved in cell wall biosynthesis
MHRVAVPGFGINVIGHVSGNLGLGVLARHVVGLLLSRGLPVRILDVDPKLGRGGQDRRFEELTVASVDDLPYSVTLLIFPPNSTVDFLRDRRNRDLLFRPDGLNAVLINWEQRVVPPEWASVLGGLDVIVAPSGFTREVFQEAIPDVPVISTKVPLLLPESVRHDRPSFGMHPDRVWFGSSFEPHSDPARKNPLAVLEAFRRALPDRHDVGLMFKVNNATVNGRIHPAVEELRARARRDGRIVLFEQALDYRTVLSLYASLDVFVSLHRSEGIGLGLMEAMALGKPVVATGWSGNMSFMDRSNACLVSYDLVPVHSDTDVYREDVLGPHAMWADPGLTNAAEWMRTLVERPDVLVGIGRRAQEAMRRYQEDAQRGSFVDQLRLIRESEVVWGIGLGRRRMRRARLEQAMAEPVVPAARPTSAWARRLRALARRVGLT